MLKYPIPKEKRLALARLYFHICTTPGTPTHIVSTCADGFITMTRSKKKVTVDDLRLPWKPIFKILDKDLWLSRRQFEIRFVYTYREYTVVFTFPQPDFMVYGLPGIANQSVLPPSSH
jgi:proteasome activator subunit 4